MKKVKSLAMAAAIIAIATSANAQTTATANATATIVTPIDIAKNVDLDFGNVAVTANAGTVILATDGSRSTTGGTTLPSTTGTVTAAEFTVTGTAGYTYAITLPSSVTLDNSGVTMVVDNFTENASKTLTGGTETFNVGATLHVDALQNAGVYSAPSGFDVTVNYN